MRRLVNRSIHGMRVVPSVDPPEYTAGPWWHITTVVGASKDTTVRAKDIYARTLDALDWSVFHDDTKPTPRKIPLAMRLQTVRCWGMGKLPIELTVYDRLGGEHRIAEICDYGSAVNYSRVGWHFGDIARQDALYPGDDAVLFEVSGASENNKVLIYINLLIRTQNAPKPTKVLAALTEGLEASPENLPSLEHMAFP